MPLTSHGMGDALRARRVLTLFALAAVVAVARPAHALDSDAVDDGSGGAEDVAGDAYADTDPSALSDFRPALDEHGAWVNDDSYGTVWVPSRAEVGSDFTPYVSAGHWVYEDEYVWASDYAWGWVPFHYGRWVWAELRGWVWIPGRAYAGAWVVWRIGIDDSPYVGWAPMAPAWVWVGGMAIGTLEVPPAPFVFCRPGDVFSPVVATRVARGEAASDALPATRPYVRAKPVVGRPVIQPALQGPPPASLGIDTSRIPRLAIDDRKVRRAQMFARPSTAMPMGARPPTPHVFHVMPRGPLPHPMQQRPAPAPRGGRPHR